MSRPQPGVTAPRDPRDMVGLNPTGRPTRSSAGKRRQEAKKASAT